LDELAKIAHDLQPSVIAATGLNSFENIDLRAFPKSARLLSGPDALLEIASAPEIDTVVAAVVGAAGLPSTLAAAKAGKRLALANKEALVVAGGLVTRAIAENGGEMIPIDSEHSAIFQAIQSGTSGEVERIILTASGGPFRDWTQTQMQSASVEDALAHPTWQMGRKITIDSATMMNKALEVIEAHWLFNLPAERIRVVMVHPQSIIHSMVEFTDGSVIAQLSPPDMRLPIQYALTYPDRECCPCPKMNWSESVQLDLTPADPERFPALNLGWEVVQRGGTCGAVVNAANEAAVELFLSGRITFPEIVEGCQRILAEHEFDPNPSLSELMRLDRWAREEIHRWASLV
jgi:1-deoxy-D-xylulose-5-phosphate reductoisomerase